MREQKGVHDKGNLIKTVMILCFLTMTCLSGCEKAGTATIATESSNASDTGFVLAGPGSYDSADTAVIVKIDSVNQEITFYNIEKERNYTLSFDGTTTYADKYGAFLSLAQLGEGDIVDITFLKSKKRLNSMALSTESWVYEGVNKFSFDENFHNVSIGDDIYKYTEETMIFSEGEQVELMDINEADVLSFQGMDKTLYSIVVDKGHGYLRLSGDEKFLGGWIEVGQANIRQITEDMLLTIPEGSYDVLLSTTGGSGTKKVRIERNQEMTLDISDIEVAKTQYGQVVFALTPSDASLYIDGTKADITTAVTLEYGIHQLIAMKDGYNTVTSYLKVAEASKGIEITLDTVDGTEDEGDDSADVSSGNSVTTGSYYQVYVDAPESVEVYLDGNYIGIAPVSFKKTEGTHVITLRRTGYETRSYTVQIDSEDKDISYSFADLLTSE